MQDFDQSQMAGYDWSQRFKDNQIAILLGLIGLFLLSWGITSTTRQSRKDSSIEIISADSDTTSEESPSMEEIIIDVSGAVQAPGVYQFPSGARINDALVAAGGLSASADRVWVTRYLNRADSLVDGSKIYIPHEGETLDSKSSNFSNSSPQQADSTNNQSFGISHGSVAGSSTGVNINSASASELDSLWGIGEVRAGQIIDNRPYTSLDQLMTKAGIPKNVYERIQDQISL